MPRTPHWFAAIAVLAAVAAGPSGSVISPKTVTLNKPDATLSDVLGELRSQTGLHVAAPGLSEGPGPVQFDRTPFWTAVEQLAAKTGTRIALGKQGREITLVKRSGPMPPSSVDGPFRVAVRQVQVRTDFESGKTFSEVTLDVHWEPRFPVFRIDSEPAITAVADDRGSRITPATAKARTSPGGFLYTTTVRIEGVPRSATKLTRLAGTFTVTSSERMLPFAFDLGGKTPVTLPAQEGVSATLRRFEKVDDRWEAELEMTYPPGQPEFESFESWVTENRARLVGPDKAKSLDPTDYDIPEQGRRVVAVYRFAGSALTNPKGWTLTYETPAPLVEFPVRFELKDIPLP
ncbi:MAG TPA: hypothetical protein VM533_21440 [Fimbriiglobus sp.]|nr:hypothetical protein [Fimbriiglobus sp.]